MSTEEKRPTRPRLTVVDGPVSKDAEGGSVTPTPIPPTVEILDGDLLYREWVPGPAGRAWWIALAIPLVVATASIAGALHASTALAIVLSLLAVVCLVVAATAWTFRGLSLVVDRAGLAWRFGLFGRRYALEEVSMFRERVFHFPKAGGMGGWGIGKAFDGTDTYEVWGANGTALDVIVRRNSVTRHYLVSSAAPDRLCAQLVRAMERRKAELAARG